MNFIKLLSLEFHTLATNNRKNGNCSENVK